MRQITEHFYYQLKQALLSLKQKPSFVLSVVATMSLALGALLCVITLIYVMLLKPLPYPEQKQLYRVDSQQFDASGSLNVTAFSYPSLLHLYKHQQVFEQVALTIYDDEVLTSHQQQPTLSTSYVTPEWFNITAAKMIIGRPFAQTDGLSSLVPEAVLSYQTWENNFAKSEDIVDKKVTFHGVSFRIIGVLSPEFIEPKINAIGRTTNVWLPFDFNSRNQAYRARWWDRANNLSFVGRLADDISIEKAQDKLSRLVNEAWQVNIDQNGYHKGWTIKVVLSSFKSIILGENDQTVFLLLLASIGLLVIAFMNIANFKLSRTYAKKHQLALRAAIGAKRKHIFNVLFTESLLLMISTMVLALVIAKFGFIVMQSQLQLILPRVDELNISLFTVCSAVLISLLLAIIFSLLSYRVIDFRKLNHSMQSSGKGSGIQISRMVRSCLIISQVTVATSLIYINISLLKESFQVITDPSVINVKGLHSVKLSQSATNELTRTEMSAIAADIKQKLSQLPQVDAVSQASSPLTDGERSWSLIDLVSNQSVLTLGKSIDCQYFSIMGQRLLLGDNFDQWHCIERAPVMIINEQLARLILANEQASIENALGKQLSFGGPGKFTIIGIVKDFPLPGTSDIPSRVYIPNLNSYNLLIKIKKNKVLTREQLMAVIQSSSNSISLFDFSALQQQKTQRLFSQYTMATTTAVLTVLTFILAAIGLYGIFSYSTQMRQFEIGTRLAIGAKGKDIVWLVIKENMSALATGLCISVLLLIGLYFSFAQYLTSYISTELLTPLLVTLLLISLLSFLSCYLPLRQYINKPVIHSLKSND